MLAFTCLTHRLALQVFEDGTQAYLWFSLLSPNYSFLLENIPPIMVSDPDSQCPSASLSVVMWSQYSRHGPGHSNSRTVPSAVQTLYYVPSHHCFIRVVLAGVENLSQVLFITSLPSYTHGNFFFFKKRSKDLTLVPVVFQHFRLSLIPVMISLDLDFSSLFGLASFMNLLDVAVLS